MFPSWRKPKMYVREMVQYYFQSIAIWASWNISSIYSLFKLSEKKIIASNKYEYIERHMDQWYSTWGQPTDPWVAVWDETAHSTWAYHVSNIESILKHEWIISKLDSFNNPNLQLIIVAHLIGSGNIPFLPLFLAAPSPSRAASLTPYSLLTVFPDKKKPLKDQFSKAETKF